MKACLLQQSFGPGFTDLHRLTLDWHLDYCSRHDFHYLSWFGQIQEIRRPSFSWIPLCRTAFSQGCRLVVKMDVDAVISDPTVDLREATGEFTHLGAVRHPASWKDWGWHFNCGVLFLQNTYETNELLRLVDLLGDMNPANGWGDQNTILTANDQLGGIVNRIDDRWNSTLNHNESPNPTIKAWHGIPDVSIRMQHVRAELERIKPLQTQAPGLTVPQ